MGDAIRSEWIKLRTARANVVLVLIAIGAPALLTALVTATAPIEQGDDTLANRFTLALSGTGIGATLLTVVGVLVIGAEFRHGTIRVTLAAVPRRLRVHGAKIVAVAAVALLAAIVAVVTSYVVGAAILGGRGHGLSLSDGGVARSLVGAIVLGPLYGLVGLGVGTIIRSTAGAITTVVAYPVVVEALVVGFVPGVGKYLPFAAGSALQSPDGARDVLPPLAGGALFLAFTAALLVLAGALLNSRDA